MKMSTADDARPDFKPDFTDVGSFLVSPVQTSEAMMKFTFGFLFNLFRLATVPAELIFRNGFGERHFNLFLYLGGSMWLLLFWTGWINIPSWFGVKTEGWMPNAIIFSVIGVYFFGAMLWQLFIRKFFAINVELHTRYDGNPLPFLYRLPFTIDSKNRPREYLVRQVVEPAFLFVLGWIVTLLLNPQTGSWLIISSIGLMLKEYVKSRAVRNIVLDQIDAELTARNLKEALAGESPKKTHGVYVTGIGNDSKEREKIKELLDKESRYTAPETTNS